jgi:hypothetical protein
VLGSPFLVDAYATEDRSRLPLGASTMKGPKRTY